mmetsp:Transcript_22603/g.19887  ORF Transcript_22603/g.19887 Transcript_22603/m.19887 type:complete len:123 (+) Transcript_22603:243-611(+)
MNTMINYITKEIKETFEKANISLVEVQAITYSHDTTRNSEIEEIQHEQKDDKKDHNKEEIVDDLDHHPSALTLGVMVAANDTVKACELIESCGYPFSFVTRARILQLARVKNIDMDDEYKYV